MTNYQHINRAKLVQRYYGISSNRTDLNGHFGDSTRDILKELQEESYSEEDSYIK